MNRIRSFLITLAIITSILLVCFVTDRSFQAQASTGYAPYNTTITVNSTADPDTSDHNTCISHTPCTLRRAVIQARNSSKSVLINFNIPTTDAGYNASLRIWKIQFSGASISKAALYFLNGDITIDGTTQPNGRANGPKIILVGYGTGQTDGIPVGGSGTDLANTLRGLGFQNFATHVYISNSSNIIENNWFGLSDDGLQPYLRNNNPENGSGSFGVVNTEGYDNIIQGNYFLGFDDAAAALNGFNAVFQNNYIGTNANGVVTGKQTTSPQLCSTVDWLGGGGISMDRPGNTVQDNVIAGLRQEIAAGSSQPNAITVKSNCDNCLIQRNKIGLDDQNHSIGVCGQGIDISDTQNVMIRYNALVNTYHTAIFINGALSDGNTLRGNIIRRSTPWLLPPGATKSDDAILRYSGLPNAFEFFNPAKVTSIVGTTVIGTAGTSSPCPNCIVELFLDDDDSITEALQPLGTTTANDIGNWSFPLEAPLPSGYGIRTTSTSLTDGTIPTMSAGTTAGLSVIYGIKYRSYLPLARK